MSYLHVYYYTGKQRVNPATSYIFAAEYIGFAFSSMLLNAEFSQINFVSIMSLKKWNTIKHTIYDSRLLEEKLKKKEDGG